MARRIPFMGFATALSLALAGGFAHAQSPMPLRYTWFGDPPANADDAHWFAIFDDQLEIALRSPAFSAHLTIDRSGGRERDEFAALYAPRMCRDLSAFQERVVSKCPARLIRYRDGAELTAVQVADVCLVRIDARPPSPLDSGWNAAQATLRVIDGASVLVFSAVFNGELVTECTVAIPLPAAAS